MSATIFKAPTDRDAWIGVLAFLLSGQRFRCAACLAPDSREPGVFAPPGRTAIAYCLCAPCFARSKRTDASELYVEVERNISDPKAETLVQPTHAGEDDDA